MLPRTPDVWRRLGNGKWRLYIVCLRLGSAIRARTRGGRRAWTSGTENGGCVFYASACELRSKSSSKHYRGVQRKAQRLSKRTDSVESAFQLFVKSRKSRWCGGTNMPRSLVERDRCERIKKRAYLPNVDEYHSSSQALTGKTPENQCSAPDMARSLINCLKYKYDFNFDSKLPRHMPYHAHTLFCYDVGPQI